MVVGYGLVAVAGGGEVDEHTVLAAGEVGSCLALAEHYAGPGSGADEVAEVGHREVRVRVRGFEHQAVA